MTKKRFIFSSLFVLGLFLLISIKLIHGQNPFYNIIVLWPNLDTGKPNLQLHTFPYITIAPPPTLNPGITKPPITGPYCDPNSIVPQGSTCHCSHGESIACPAPASDCPWNKLKIPIPPGSANLYCVEILGGGVMPSPPPSCFAACLAKPVVYLYPPRTTDVSVSVEAPGSVIVSDPHYPDGGWKHVLAHPDGTLWYNNKKYSELFYETSLTQKVPAPEKGIVMASADIENILRKTTTQFGLNTREQKDFLDYWVPKLQSLHSPYIFFSILDPETKESLDKLIISPEPDTRIELIAYFKPLQAPILVPPLSLPDQPPKRIGFTEVEWGGTIAN